MSFIKAKDLDKIGKRWPNLYSLTKEDAIGNIKGWPLEVITLALKEMEIQNPYTNNLLSDLQKYKIDSLFIFSKTKDGVYFWKKILDGKFNIFYKNYTPRKLIERLEEE